MYYRVNFDGSGLQLLTPERANHVITPAPDNRFFVDTWSTPTEPQVTAIRDNTGKIVVGCGPRRHLPAEGDGLDSARAD